VLRSLSLQEPPLLATTISSHAVSGSGKYWPHGDWKAKRACRQKQAQGVKTMKMRCFMFVSALALAVFSPWITGIS
jgi:hypothetical protein